MLLGGTHRRNLETPPSVQASTTPTGQPQVSRPTPISNLAMLDAESPHAFERWSLWETRRLNRSLVFFVSRNAVSLLMLGGGRVTPDRPDKRKQP